MLMEKNRSIRIVSWILLVLENVSLADILSLRDRCLLEQDIWAVCLECAHSLKSISHSPLFHTLCITPDTLAFNANGNVCFMEQLSDDPEGAFVPPEFDRTGNTFEAHIYSLGSTLTAAIEYVIEPELEPELSQELKMILEQMQLEKPEDRPDIETVIRLGEGNTKCASAAICRKLSAIGRRVLSISFFYRYCIIVQLCPHPPPHGCESPWKVKERQAGVGRELQDYERNPADGSSSTEDLVFDPNLLKNQIANAAERKGKCMQDVVVSLKNDCTVQNSVEERRENEKQSLSNENQDTLDLQSELDTTSIEPKKMSPAMNLKLAKLSKEKDCPRVESSTPTEQTASSLSDFNKDSTLPFLPFKASRTVSVTDLSEILPEEKKFPSLEILTDDSSTSYTNLSEPLLPQEEMHFETTESSGYLPMNNKTTSSPVEVEDFTSPVHCIQSPTEENKNAVSSPDTKPVFGNSNLNHKHAQIKSSSVNESWINNNIYQTEDNHMKKSMLCLNEETQDEVCVYGVAAILWAAAKFNFSPNQKLALPRKLKRLLLEMAKRTPIERPSIAAARKSTKNEYKSSSAKQQVKAIKKEILEKKGLELVSDIENDVNENVINERQENSQNSTLRQQCSPSSKENTLVNSESFPVLLNSAGCTDAKKKSVPTATSSSRSSAASVLPSSPIVNNFFLRQDPKTGLITLLPVQVAIPEQSPGLEFSIEPGSSSHQKRSSVLGETKNVDMVVMSANPKSNLCETSDGSGHSITLVNHYHTLKENAADVERATTSPPISSVTQDIPRILSKGHTGKNEARPVEIVDSFVDSCGDLTVTHGSSLSLDQRSSSRQKVMCLIKEEFAFDGYLENGVEDLAMGEYILSLKELQFGTFCNAVSEKFCDLYWDERLLETLYKVVNGKHPQTSRIYSKSVLSFDSSAPVSRKQRKSQDICEKSPINLQRNVPLNQRQLPGHLPSLPATGTLYLPDERCTEEGTETADSVSPAEPDKESLPDTEIELPWKDTFDEMDMKDLHPDSNDDNPKNPEPSPLSGKEGYVSSRACTLGEKDQLSLDYTEETEDTDSVSSGRMPENSRSSSPFQTNVRKCNPGWTSVFYGADCFGEEVLNYVKKLGRRNEAQCMDVKMLAWKNLSSKVSEIMEELKAVQVFLKSDNLCLMEGDRFKKLPTIPSAHLLAMHVQQLEIGALTMANGAYKWPKLSISEIAGHPDFVKRKEPVACGRPVAMLCWGNASFGQLGVGGIDEEIVIEPRSCKFFHGKKIRDVGCGRRHTVFVLEEGTVYTCGCNDLGQLGHEKARKKPEHVGALDAQNIVAVSCGEAHTLALNDKGQVFAWGPAADGQLGLPSTEECVRVPRTIKSLSDVQIIQIIRSLLGVPFAQIAAGGAHSFTLTLSGAVFGWGRNKFGQLGLNDERDRYAPVLLKSLRTQKIVYISCGEDHTAALTKEGGVFTFGAGGYGQLGHNTTSHEINPRKVFELMGSVVTQIACGR
ncbi:UNVERIFIED_CONTAM: hypothetical protein FKN15_039174 [Acipenser sinensis]